MLNSFLRSEIRQVIILLVFAGLLFETLTIATVGLILIGTVLVWYKIKPSRLIRNALSLGIFASYWITYGKVIDPEIGLNFLTSIIMLKLLEKESERDSYMIFFGLILLIAAGSLFQKSLSYVFFFGGSFLLLIQDFYKTLKLPTKLMDLLQSLVWVLPFTALLFFLAPRMMNPFQLGKGTPKDGEVGYTPEVNMSQVENLTSNDQPVFQASVEKPIPAQDLYWRGNTLTFSDGWNWPVMPQNRTQIEFDPTLRSENIQGIRQRIRMLSQQDFYFGFDSPSYFFSPLGVAQLNSARTLSQHRWKPSQNYEVISSPAGIIDSSLNETSHSKTGLKKDERAWILETFKSTTLPELSREIEQYFQSQKFSYSLSPGRIENFLDFMTSKKIGFCSHYASALGQILRTKDIPTRLVSGFLGGSYNRFASFYLVTQNDAHVWVEGLHEGKWIRLDPTSWIAPDRVNLGGEAYMQKLASGGNSVLGSLGSRLAFINDFKQWFAQWDFEFYQWLEEMDYYGQSALLEKLKLKREHLYSLVPIILALFMGAYAWQLSRGLAQHSELERLWHNFQRKMSLRGIQLPLLSIREGQRLLTLEDENTKKIWSELVEASFGASSGDLGALKKKIESL